MTKQCTKCNQEKSFSSFAKNKKGKFGLYCHCKECHNKCGRERHGNYLNKFINRAKMLRKYWPGSTAQEAYDNYTDMHRRQEGKCLICLRTEAEFGDILAVDHCHRTHRVRGLLCDNCNKAIGSLQDNPILLMRAASYLGHFG